MQARRGKEYQPMTQIRQRLCASVYLLYFTYFPSTSEALVEHHSIWSVKADLSTYSTPVYQRTGISILTAQCHLLERRIFRTLVQLVSDPV